MSAAPDPRTPDLLVLGAGPAGISAAIAASKVGLEVELVDETRSPGGQVYRHPPPGAPSGARGPDAAIGDDLRARLAASSARFIGQTRVWFAGPGFSVAGIGPDGPVEWAPRAVVVATGTTERFIPITNGTLPGVVGLAGATILLKTHRVLPGARTLVVGAGPLLPAVAAGILKGGGEVAAIVDLGSRGDWIRRTPAMLARRDLIRQGLGWLRQIGKAGVSILHRQTLLRVEGEDSVTGATVAPCDASGAVTDRGKTRHFACDAVAVGHGLVPATELTRLMGAEHEYNHASGGWRVRIGDDQHTSVPGLFSAGDGTGITGAAAAAVEGRLAALAAARHLGRLDAAAFETAAAPVRRELASARRFGGAMGTLMAMREGLIEQIEPDTVVCRCEDITWREIDGAVQSGVRTLNQLKSATRCGMGPCQGRMCGEAAATLIARGSGNDRVSVSQWTARAPARPVRMGDLIGEYSYDDIPKAPPAPA